MWTVFGMIQLFIFFLEIKNHSFPPTSPLPHMYDPGTKGHQAELCHLEALQSKGNANDSHTEQKTDDHIGYRQFNASDKNPYEIYKKRYCTHTIIGHFFPKRKKL